jgi:SanA protein
MAALLAGSALLVFGLNLWVVQSVDSEVFYRIDAAPKNDVGLVLGTRRWLAEGRENLHFRSRVRGGAELYRAGKVKHLLLSGDNRTHGYNEAADMKAALLDLGVPESSMTLDFAGRRTLDSVVRAKEVFGQSKLTVITDDFHIHRGVFLARHFGIEAVGFSTGRVPVRYSVRSRLREAGARIKAVLDLYVLRTRPHFLGEPIAITIIGPP